MRPALKVMQKGRSRMYEDEAPPATRTQGESLDGIKRLDLLSRRFSEEEIQRLSALQQLRGERPDVLDRSIQEGRLQFVRWLVQHGRLGQGDTTDGEEASLEEESPGAKHPHGSWPTSPGTDAARTRAAASAGSASCEQVPDHAAENQSDNEKQSGNQCAPLHCVWAWIRTGFARAAGIGSQLGSWVFLPNEAAEIDPLSLRDPNGSPWTYMDDPWPWTHFRSGW